MQRLSRSSTGLVIASLPSTPEQIPGPVQSHPPGQLQALQLPPDPRPSSFPQDPAREDPPTWVLLPALELIPTLATLRPPSPSSLQAQVLGPVQTHPPGQAPGTKEVELQATASLLLALSLPSETEEEKQ